MNSRFTRKALTTFAAVAIAAGGATGLATAAQAAPATPAAVVANHKVVRTGWIKSPDGFANIRKGPGTSYKVIGKLKSGTKVTVVEVCGGWSRLSTGGWVANWLISSSKPAPAKPAKPSPKPTKPAPKPKPEPTKPCPTKSKPEPTKPTPTPTKTHHKPTPTPTPTKTHHKPKPTPTPTPTPTITDTGETLGPDTTGTTEG